jgi:hypothetical protein
VTELLAAIEAATLVRAVATAPGLYPLVSALHVVAIALLFGPIVLADLRLTGLFDARLDPVMPLLKRTALLGFALAAATGLLLASVQLATRYATNPAFLLKLGLIVAAGLNLLIHERFGRAAPGGARAAVAGGLSILLWLGVILAGRWIAFVD